MFDVEGFILVGGHSSRMGTDKSQLLFGTESGVERIAAALGALTPKISLVGGRDLTTSAGLPVIPDTLDHWGALGGIEAALAACRSKWAIIVACDLPFVTRELFARLWQNTSDDQTFDTIVPIQPDERPQPLCAIYRRESCSVKIRELIDDGEHKPRVLLAKVRTHWVSFDDLSDLQGAENFFLNVNTPIDYEHAKEILNPST
jgi:molybdopterin-guanine dinucleotide biosynthesis protein A